MRHLQRYLCGQDLDPDDLVTNLGAAMANISIILDAEAAGTLVDDRPPSIPLDAVYTDVEESVQRLRKKYDDKDPKHYTIEDTTPEVQDRMLDQVTNSLVELFEPKFEEPAPATEKLEVKLIIGTNPPVPEYGDFNDEGMTTFFHPTFVQPIVSQRAFKVGDRVSAKLTTLSVEEGAIGFVEEDDGEEEEDMPYYVVFKNNRGWFRASELELALKVGAKVRCTKKSMRSFGLEGEVVSPFPTIVDGWSVKWSDGFEAYYFPSELEVIG